MSIPNKPPNESARLKFLHELEILDTEPELVLDRIIFTISIIPSLRNRKFRHEDAGV
jgi:hypothetical protein